ncbi:MAG: hypothetical protein D6820_17175, partial [Lentisphaerae bacterium]
MGGMLLCSRASPWEHVGLNGGGAMFHLVSSPHDPKVMIVASDMSGMFRSVDGGRHWQLIHHSQVRGNPRCAVLFDPDQPGIVYAPSSAWSTRLMRSTDNGRQWSFWRNTPDNRPVTLLYRQNEYFYASTSRGLFRCSIKKAWQRIDGIRGEVRWLCGSGTRILAATGERLYRSLDNGKTFVPCPLPEHAAIRGIAANRHYQYLLLTCRLERGRLTGGVFRSSDFGMQWVSLMGNGLDVSTHRKSRWANGDIPQYRFILTSDAAPDRVYVYCSGTSYYPPNHSTVYRSDDAGKHWRPVFYSDPRFGKKYNVEDDRLTLELGQRYQYPPISLTMNARFSDVLCMATDMMLFISFDGGRRWQVSQSGVPQKVGGHFAFESNGLGVTTTWSYEIDPFDPRRHYICYTDVGLARSVDGGKRWIWEGVHLPWRNTCYQLAFDPEIPGRIWGAFSQTHDIPNYNIIGHRHRVIMRGGVGVSHDHGDTWRKLELPEAPCTGIVLDPRSSSRSRRLYAALFEKGVYFSVDGGRHWSPCPTQPGNVLNRRVSRLYLHPSSG